MTRLADLPCLWVTPDPAPPTAIYRMNRYLPDYFRTTPEDSEATIRFLQRETAERVLVIGTDLLPHSGLPLYVPDPLLMASRLTFRLLSRNSVTDGFDDRHGPLVCHREALLGGLPPPDADVVVPVALCDWRCNSTAASAFAAGFDTAAALTEPEASFVASLGADAPHGLAWCLGAFRALGGATDCTAAWTQEEVFLADPAVTAQRVNDLARRLRIEEGISVRPLAPAESRLAKALAGEWPPARMFEAIAAVYDTLGECGATTADRYRQAAFWVWGNV